MKRRKKLIICKLKDLKKNLKNTIKKEKSLYSNPEKVRI